MCCLAPVKVVSKEANSLIKLYSQYAPPGTLCNLLFNTPPPNTHKPLPPCLAEVSVFVAVEQSGNQVFLGVENKKEEGGSETQGGDEGAKDVAPPRTKSDSAWR